jgi:hypothetical protein
MPRYSKRRRGWKSLLRIGIIPALALACILGLLYAELAFRHRQKTTWSAITATVQETRLRPVAKYALEYGSKDLYEVDVLVSYSSNGAPLKNWVPLSEAPKPLANAQATQRDLNGKTCLVRWDSASPDDRTADCH